MAFVIKRNDRLPYLAFQFFQSNGTTPLDVSTATQINMVCRVKDAPIDEPPKFKAPVSMLNAAQGIGEYRWASGDTDTPGNFQYEFEITWPGNLLQTIPADSYLDLIVLDDAG